MNSLEWLKPTWTKVGLAIVLFVIASFIWKSMYLVMDAWFFGFPLSMMGGNGFCPPPEINPECGKPHYLLDGLVLDALFWYLVSAGLLKLAKK